ncbi:hypothetical protein AWB81_03095 [Caballeronia arationis]|uniref:hypothetical protein n=1 Tax=Caballeronia arationis TaxID=1777142 RepID=UPI00074C5A0D|nr:hypothetical protein [Caballeronia arationis]SAK70369.1 hypothetical protein AWB81_03095 [Caballeronia arationis]
MKILFTKFQYGRGVGHDTCIVAIARACEATPDFRRTRLNAGAGLTVHVGEAFLYR